jgi:hypothetical protein
MNGKFCSKVNNGRESRRNFHAKPKVAGNAAQREIYERIIKRSKTSGYLKKILLYVNFAAYGRKFCWIRGEFLCCLL